jgi:hypothetical protein
VRLCAHFRLAFASASRDRLTSPHTANSQAHSSKGTPSPPLVTQRRLRQLVGSRFQVLFHSPPGVLFTFPSRYWFTIGRQGVLSLRGWALQIHTEFHGLRATRDPREEAGLRFDYRAITSCGGPFHGLRLRAGFVTPCTRRCRYTRVPRPRDGNATGLSHRLGLGSSPFARRYLGSRGCFPFLALLRCFTSGGSLLRSYGFRPG